MPSQASEFAPQQRRVNKIALPNTKNKKLALQPSWSAEESRRNKRCLQRRVRCQNAIPCAMLANYYVTTLMRYASERPHEIDREKPSFWLPNSSHPQV